jgi:hypothetical protein
MFDYIFEDVREQFGVDGNVYQTSAKEWETKATRLLTSLTLEMNYLFWTAKAIFSEEVFGHSQTEFLYPTKPAPCVSTVKLSPREDIRQPLGMSFEATLHTGYNGASFARPDVFFELAFWDSGLLAIRTLLRNHKRVVELLLEGLNVELETNRPIERVDRYRGKDLEKKLELYLSGPDEADTTLTLSSEFRVDTRPEAIIKTFLVFIAIYDSCYHSARKPRDVNRIVKFFRKLR